MDTQETKTADLNFQLQQAQEEMQAIIMQTKTGAEHRETLEKRASEMEQRSKELSTEVDKKSRQAEMLALELVSLRKTQRDTAIVSLISRV